MNDKKEGMIHLLIESIIEPKDWPAGEGAGLLNFELQRGGLPSPRRILVIQLTSIGDVVMTTPVIEGLREKYPGAYIAFLVDEPSLDVVKGNPFLDEVILFDEYRYFKDIKSNQKTINEVESELACFIEDLRSREFDLVLNFHLSKRAAIISRLIGAEESIGLNIDKDGSLFVRGNLWMYYMYLRMFIHQRREVPGRFIHQAELNLRLAGLSPGRYKTHVEIGEEGSKEGLIFLTSHGVGEGEFLVGLSPGANWASRRWPWQKFVRLGDELYKEYDARIIIFGGPDDVRLGERMADAMKIDPIDATGRLGLKGLSQVLSKCKLLITNDTGPMHIAGAIGTPVISISGPVFGGPYGRDGHIILHRDLDCIGCGRTGCEDHRCMEEIEVQDVIMAVRASLYENGSCEINGIKLCSSGLGDPGPVFSYMPYDLQSQENLEKVLGLVYLKYWEYLNLALTGRGEETISVEEIVFEIRHTLNGGRELGSRIKEEMDKFIKLEDLCAHGEELSQRLHSLIKFGVRSSDSGEKQEEGKEIDELLARLHILDEEIEETGSPGRFLRFLGLLERNSILDEDRKSRIVRDSCFNYHTKKEACIYIHSILESILEGL